MKKFLITILLAAGSLGATAKEIVQIIYGFSSADHVANYGRALADEANKIQDKYTFVFDVKPGAGNAIAGNYVKNTPNSIFMTSGVFWVRPAFYPNESYNPMDFQALMTQCQAPFAIASKKYSNWKSVPITQPLTIATSGLGVISHLMAIEIVKTYPNAIVVPFKSTADAVVAAMGGQVDLVVGFIRDFESFEQDTGNGKLTVLGTTGSGYVGKYPNLTSQGFSSTLAKMNTPFTLMIPTSFPEDKAKEIRNILLKAETAQSVRDFYKSGYCQPFQVPEKNLKSWWNDQAKYWTDLTIGVKISQ